MKQSTKIPIILSEKYNLLEIIFVKRFCSKTAGKNIDQKPSHNTKYCLKKLQRSGKLPIAIGATDPACSKRTRVSLEKGHHDKQFQFKN